MKITNKQKEVIECIKNDNPKILICSGAKRAGKTWILIYAFIAHIAKYENKGYSFILGGTNQASIRRNVLNDLEDILGHEIKLTKDNHFKLFGNKVYVFDGANADSYKKMRGFTSYGAFLNEATTLHDSFVKEAISRCSGEGARIYMDTNPENPTHTVKTDYVDKDGQKLSNGQLNIKAFNFTLYDNTFLNKEYIESIEASTPTGMFYDRDILGVWVASEGVVYKDFNKDIHYIKDLNNIDIVKYFCGVDFGWEHFGSMVVVGKDINNNYYLIKEYAYQHKDIEEWINIAKDIKVQYGNINFYCDHARPDYIDKLRRNNIRAINANKNVLEGISTIATLFKTNKLLVLEDKVNLFKKEIYNYVWAKGKDEPIKQNDDVLDSLRYAIYTDIKMSGSSFNRIKYGI
ncbi:MAG: PBSX family phage terminase large subunit [Peptostreptococcaceae bacterium]|nr:PBSX family phage terminase large subunit [Peptostreptococcaceae bacterium]